MRLLKAVNIALVLSTACLGTPLRGQEAVPDELPDEIPPGARASESLEQRETLEQCAAVPGAIDISVLDDRHVYIRTRGSNHYLLTTEQCDRMYTNYVRDGIQLVPYGRRVCRNDGSHLLYVDGGRPRTCLIEFVQRVENRAAARELAIGGPPIVVFEPVELESSDANDPEAEPAP